MFNFLTHINLPPYLLFTVIVLGILTYYFHKDISKLITKKWSEDNDIKDLKSHDIFNTLERVKQEAMFLKFYSHGKYDETKSRMSSDFVIFKCDVCFDKFSEFLDNDFKNISNDELKQLMLSAMWSMHHEYVKQIKAHWIERGIDKKNVDYVIHLFENFRHDVVVSFQHRIDAIFSCEHYNTNFEKILATYNVFAMGIDLLPKDLLTTFENINGRFTDINYN
ncbi:hypothetical protein UFOVP200_31 [uncultured Caudovirales phage]|uniref:Uncharacterized protein n=1 Tax=uncultured Caudovirales phage TaxID=2100421 RepID=A0A6J7WI83_9CAUD|nr:hypothetical protein UFOVP200_31 [uncultured Caudovirales phage]